MEKTAVRWVKVHPLVVRLTHALNALAVVIMVMSGWRIYNASPLFNFRFPAEITLGGWLAGALQWHFAALWLLGLNGLVYLAYNIASGRLGRQFWPVDWRDITGLRLVHDLARGEYNAFQKLAYLGVMLALVVVVLSGLVVWKPVQFPLLRAVMGDYDNARIVHFCAMSAIVAFVAGHVVMALAVPKSLVAITGLGKRRLRDGV